MPNRPSIPAEIKRQIFIESGHKCAVCGTDCPLERAHIIPWHKSKEHKAEDLICLCANCHARADKEDWGEKTLREYKQKPWILRQYKDTGSAHGNFQERVEAGRKMSTRNQTPIVFTVAVDQDDWDKQFGGWRCSALRIPGAQVDDVFKEGSRVDKSWYEVMPKHAMIRWIPQNPPEKALIIISLTEELSTQELTNRWKKLATLLPFIAAILAALITGIFTYLSSRTPSVSNSNISNSREHVGAERADITFNRSVRGECGLITIDGSVQKPDGSPEKNALLSWDWGDGTVVYSPFPANHTYTQVNTYMVKVTAYVDNNKADEKNYKVVIDKTCH
ncbi:MAG TPA: HNH endonuclease [Pyrinomonadaceae bacterium]|nr:HNH endonuclease [Pyrinomonadaceae bacterium]